MKKNVLLSCFLGLGCFVSIPSTLAAQDKTRISKPSLSITMQLYLLNPNSVFFVQPKPISLDLHVDPLLASPQYNDDMYIRQIMSIEQVGQSISMNLQTEQRNLQALGILNMVATSFVWGMIIKENIEGYYDFKAQSQQPQQRPERPLEVRRPSK